MVLSGYTRKKWIIYYLLRKAYPEVFGQNAFKEWRVSDNDWNDGRYIRLETVDGKQLVVVGNFTDRPVDMQHVFPVTGEWYNFCNEGVPENTSS